MPRLFRRAPSVHAAPENQESSSNLGSDNPTFDDPASEEELTANGGGSPLLDADQEVSFRFSRAGIAIPYTEIPAPRLLRNFGYVEAAFTHIPNSLQQPQQQQQQQQQQISPVSGDDEQRKLIGRGDSQVRLENRSLSHENSAKFSSLDSAVSASTGSTDTGCSYQSGANSLLSLRPNPSPLAIRRDTVSLRSPSLSPDEDQPFTLTERDVRSVCVVCVCVRACVSGSSRYKAPSNDVIA